MYKTCKEAIWRTFILYRALLYDIANLYYNLGDAFSALQYAEEEMRLNQQCADTLDIIYLRNQTTLANLYSHYDLGKSAAYFTSVVRKITHNEFLTEQHWTYLQWPMEERISELLFLIQVFNNIFDTITSLPDMEIILNTVHKWTVHETNS